MLGGVRALRLLERPVPACSAALPLAAAATERAVAAAINPQPLLSAVAARCRNTFSSVSGSVSGSGSEKETIEQEAGSSGAAGAHPEPDRWQAHEPHWQQQHDPAGHSYAHQNSSSGAHHFSAGGGQFSDDDGATSAGARHEDDAAFQQQRRQLLAAALRHVPCLGWSGGAAAAAAAAGLGLSPAAAGMLGSDAQFVQAFVKDCNGRLDEQLAAMPVGLGNMEERERVREGLRMRLHMLRPVAGTWAQALALLASPGAAPRTLQLYTQLADTIWHAAGDTSTDLSWYSKRALVAGVYSAMELYMLTDTSPDFADTWAALDRRLEGAWALGAAAGDAGSLAGVFSGKGALHGFSPLPGHRRCFGGAGGARCCVHWWRRCCAGVAISAAANTKGGGVVYVPRGTYKFANPIYLNRSNVVLRGDGAATTKLIFTRSLSQIYKGSLRVDREGKVKTAWGSAGGLLMVGGLGQNFLVTRFNSARRYRHDLTVVAGTLLSVYSQGRGQDVNMDHHRYRAGPMANLFSNIDMGAAARPFESGGRSDRAAHTGRGASFWNLYGAAPVALPTCDVGSYLNVVLPRWRGGTCAAKRWSVLTWRSTMPKDLHLWQAQQRWAWRRA
ncbi:ubiquinone biosynthesis [Micractinium conductrix]|uniref:Ubiquinone biosynthesis protein n=1 Tax=Micractinium conductrix TaxID=554055 RepID=A0A2P6VEY9_9CHLO|nr:ubiquinone biosynthesis [Micractinium conductrix]|eukprot:PSC72641.1 ubiquinone biosynthesis [Micractinium conductrix]